MCSYNIVTCMSDYRRGLVLVIGVIDNLQIVTTSNYNIIAISTIYSSLEHALSFFSLFSLHQSFPGNGFQRRTFPLLWVPELSPASATSF
jgi:hypothetical protein